MKNLISLFFLILGLNSSFAQTVLPTIITQNTTLLKQNSPYLINSSTLVSDNITLTIEGGVVLNINGALNIRGLLFCLGSENDSIRINCNNLNAPGIRIVKGISDTLNNYSLFNYCVIRSNNIGLYSFNKKIEINNSNISNCPSDGVFIENGAIRIKNTKINNNGGKGIYTNSENFNQIAVDSCYIINCSISNNQKQGIDWKLNGGDFENPIIEYNVSFSYNEIKNNGLEGLRLYGSGHRTYINNNVFCENNAFPIMLGINGSYETPNTKMWNNIISKNNGALGTYIPNSSKIWNNIFVENKVNNNTLEGLSHYNPGTFDFKLSSTFFKNNVVLNNDFDNLISYTPDGNYDSLNISNNLFYFNKPNSTNSSSFLFLSPQSFSSNSNQWDKNKFFGNNIYFDLSSPFWIKNHYQIIDYIVSNNYKNTPKSNFDGQNGFYGFVYELDPLPEPDINSPISPVKYALFDSIGIKYVVWKQNPERDLKGYKLYYGKFSDFEYSYNIDLGLKNIFQIPNDLIGFNDFTVTAYDKDADGLNDFFEGHESWYSEAQIGPGIIIKKGSEILQSPVSACPNQTYYLKSIGNCASVLWNTGSTSSDLAINNLNVNSSYYFDCINNSPIEYSTRSEIVNFYVNPTQFNQNTILPDGTVQFFNAQKIGSSSLFGSNSEIKMEARNQIILEPGFFFGGAKKFTAEIKNCPN